MSKKVPEDELVLAELIAAASCHKLSGTRGYRFRRGYNGAGLGAGECGVAAGSLAVPPEGATHCCALGAQMLARNIEDPIRSYVGNDAAFDSSAPHGKELRDWNISAAFNLAMDTEAKL